MPVIAGKFKRGPSIGRYKDRDIPAWVEVQGRRFLFVGVTGPVVDLTTLKDEQCVMAPGLLFDGDPALLKEKETPCT